jgi:circadian clock protein KaiC
MVDYTELPRTKIGIQEMDSLLNGGIPEGNIVLVSGGAGTGKSTFALQFIVNGSTLFGEKGLYISTEQNRAELMKQASGFKWDIEGLEQRNLLKIMYFDVASGNGFLKELEDVVATFKPKRLVIDSLTTLTDALLVSGIGEGSDFSMVQIAETVNPIPRTDKIIAKSILYSLFKVLKKFKLTTILTTELPEDQSQLSADGVSEFIADGVIIFKYLTVGEASARNLEVKKMRYTPIEGGIRSYEFSGTGIVLS